jgi:hypothetical protein
LLGRLLERLDADPAADQQDINLMSHTPDVFAIEILPMLLLVGFIRPANLT